jgi:hypothetical protein
VHLLDGGGVDAGVRSGDVPYVLALCLTKHRVSLIPSNNIGKKL